MRILSPVLVLSLCANSFCAGLEDSLQIKVLSGEDAVVTTSSGRGADIRLRVIDSDKRPVRRATVSAILPVLGVGGHFRGGATIATQETDDEGEVQFSGIRLRPLTGEFTTVVKARRGSETGSVQVTQHVSNGPEGPQGWLSRRNLVIMGVAAAGVTAGIVASTVGGASGGNAAPNFRVTPGSPTTTGPR